MRCPLSFRRQKIKNKIKNALYRAHYAFAGYGSAAAAADARAMTRCEGTERARPTRQTRVVNTAGPGTRVFEIRSGGTFGFPDSPTGNRRLFFRALLRYSSNTPRTQACVVVFISSPSEIDVK